MELQYDYHHLVIIPADVQLIVLSGPSTVLNGLSHTIKTIIKFFLLFSLYSVHVSSLLWIAVLGGGKISAKQYYTCTALYDARVSHKATGCT